MDKWLIEIKTKQCLNEINNDLNFIIDNNLSLNDIIDLYGENNVIVRRNTAMWKSETVYQNRYWSSPISVKLANMLMNN